MSNRESLSVAVAGYYLVALVGIGMSADTSWLLSGAVLHLSGPVRYGLFAFVELLYVAGALGMRESVRAGRRPGVHRGIVWALSAYSAFAAVLVAGPVGGLVRLSAVVAGLVALHVAFGIELRKARGGQRLSALAWLAQWHWMLYPHLAIGTVRRVARAHADAARTAELSAVTDRYAVTMTGHRDQTSQATTVTTGHSDRMTGPAATVPSDQDGHGGQVRPLPVTYDPDRTELIERATGRPVSSVTSTDREHRDRLTGMTSDAQRVRYAVGVTGHDRPAAVVEWLTDQGHPVSTEAARSTMRRMRDQRATVTTLARSATGQR